MSRSAWLAMVALGCGQGAASVVARAPSDVSGRGSATGNAAGGSVAAQRPLAEDLPRLALRARDLYLAWQAAYADGSIDCATATLRTNDIATTFSDVTFANREIWRGGHERIKAFRAELDTYEAEISPAAKAIVESPIMGRCALDPAFSQAVDRLAGEG